MTTAAYGIENTFPFYPGLDGQPLQGGSVWFGAPGQNPVTSPQTVYSDAAATQPIAQPVGIANGRTVDKNGIPVSVYVAGDFSRLVQDSLGRQLLFQSSQPPTQSAVQSQNWAQQTGSDVTGAPAGSRSSKSWSQDDLHGATYGGSAKDWAQSSSLPDGVSKSSKTYANDAQGQASAAAASVTAAANYAAAAATGAKFFNTIALGNAAVADAATFGVIAGGSDGLTRPGIYRRESAGVSTALYPVLPASEYDALLPTISGVTPIWGVNDDRGNALAVADPAGSLTIANLIPLQTNGLDQRYRTRPASLGNFDAELMTFIADGQSNCTGRIPGVTLAQEFDNIGFPYQASSPVSTLALDVLNCSAPTGNAGGAAESILFGALGYIKLLLQQENGLSPTDIAFQLLGADNSLGSTAISVHQRGSSFYTHGTQQATSAVTIGAAANRSVAHGGVFWNQGEADSATALATYQASLQTMASNYNTDLKAITGQTKDITVITAQTTSTPANRNIALAQLAAANALSLIKMCCPMYQFDYESDGIHVINRHDYWMGAYYGLAWKRMWVDLLTWHAVQPLSSTKSGKLAYVTFDCMVQPLVLDTSGVPAQTNYGFTMVDSGGSDLPISSVSVSAPNKVKIVAASSIPAGAKLRYGFNAATGKGAYTGAAGNLRDSQGLCVPTANGYSMHNWCAVFEFGL